MSEQTADRMVTLRERFDSALGEFLRARTTELAGIGPELRALSDAASALLTAGKRLRPAFCYWAWRSAGAPDSASIVTAAASLELLQASAIVHDDVMDGSDVRRGMPAVHRRLETLHRDADWQGSAAGFGVGGAILLGDLLLGWTDQMFRSSGIAVDRLMAAYPLVDVMRTEVMSGQYLDLVAQASTDAGPESPVERAMRVVRFKSAKYSVERPLQLGATLAGGPDELVEGLSRFGLPLGEAFQLRDDVLGVFGDPEVTGKPAGDDLREGKRTVLVTKALSLASPDAAGVLSRGLGSADLDAAGVDELRTIIVETGALEFVEELIGSLATSAEKALDELTMPLEAREALGELSHAAIARTS